MSAALEPGLWVILATPFDATGSVDVESLDRQVGLARDVGADGVVALGVFGEAAKLSLVEQRQVASAVASGGMPAVFGVSGRSTAVATEQADAVLNAAGRSDARLMVQVNATTADAIGAHLSAIHEATGADVVLQDYPAISGVHVASSTLLDVLHECPFVVAIKAEAPPTPAAIGELVAGTDRPVFGGLGGVGLVDELAMGAAGAMTGFSHPEGLRQTIDAYAAGGFTAACAAWAPWLPLANFEAQSGIQLSIRKTLLYRRGVLAHPGVRPPAMVMPERLRPLLEQHLAHVPAH